MNINRLNAANFGGVKTLQIIDVTKVSSLPSPDSSGFISIAGITYKPGYSASDFNTYKFKNGDCNYEISNSPENGDDLEECVVSGIFPKDQNSILQHLLSLASAQYIAIVYCLNDYDDGTPVRLIIGTVNCPAVIVRGKRSSGKDIATLNYSDFNLICRKKQITPFAID
jgi:hypothetical protein